MERGVHENLSVHVKHRGVKVPTVAQDVEVMVDLIGAVEEHPMKVTKRVGVLSIDRKHQVARLETELTREGAASEHAHDEAPAGVLNQHAQVRTVLKALRFSGLRSERRGAEGRGTERESQKQQTCDVLHE